MRKPDDKRKLPIATLIVAGGLVFGCGDAVHPNEELAPDFLSVEELSSSYDDRIGQAVIVEGRLIVADDGQYFLAEMIDVVQAKQGFRVALKLELGSVREDRMARCLSGPTLVSGVIARTNEIQVQYVKLTSDARMLLPENCYSHSD